MLRLTALTVLTTVGCLAQDISFREDKQLCTTIGGPSAGQPCVLPFKFMGKLRTGCTTENDPDGKYWCSTKVDKDGNHIPKQDNWAHCGQGCQQEKEESSSESPNPEGRQINLGNVEGTICSTSSGELGTCHFPSNCGGVSLSFLELNACSLSDGSSGVCCQDITSNNIVKIVDSNDISVDIPSISFAEVDNALRFGGPGLASPAFQSSPPFQDAPLPDTGFFAASSGSPASGGSEDEDDTGPSEFHLRFNTPRKDILAASEDAEVLLDATRRIQANNNLTDLQAGIGLRSSFNSDTNPQIDQRCPWTPAPTCNPSLVYRTFDGTCNNLKEPNFGRTGTPFQRILLPEYAKGTVDQPRRRTDANIELPSARQISNALADGTNSNDNDNTVLVMQMGQFIDHDLTHTPNHGVQCCAKGGKFPRTFDPKKCFPIRLFNNDPFWKGKKTCMNFARSLSSPSLKCGLQSREQLNQITHWLDGSNIYGSTTSEAMHLRGDRGRMKVSAQRGSSFGSLPSCAREQTGKVTGCDVCGGRKKDCFFAGDFRVNEQLNLIVMHTIFMREHNRVASQLEIMNPTWSDNKIYQEARKITTAEYQHIVYKEWLPIIIGNTFMRSYGLFPLNSGFSFDYAQNFDPRINNEFATAAFRFGHSMIPRTFSSKTNGRSEKILNLREIFFKPKEMSTPGFLDGMVRGMTEQGSSLWDPSFIPDVRNHLFESRPGSGGLDLVAVNIQRGRDHGIPGYNKYREICLGQKAKTWEDLSGSLSINHINQLRRIYNSVDDVDLYVGGFLEAAHEDSILGPVFKCIIGDQFARLKKGDRFFYDLGLDSKTSFTQEQLDQIRKTSMARLICDNTDDIDRVQPLAFKLATKSANQLQNCNFGSIPEVALGVFRESRG